MRGLFIRGWNEKFCENENKNGKIGPKHPNEKKLCRSINTNFRSKKFFHLHSQDPFNPLSYTQKKYHLIL